MFNTRKMELLATAAGLAAGLALGLNSNALAQAAKGDHWKEKADIPHSQIDGAEKADFSKKKAGKPVSGKEAENQEHMQRQTDGAAHPAPGEKTAMPKASKSDKKLSPQKVKDLEHEQVQTDGVKHPREVVGK